MTYKFETFLVLPMSASLTFASLANPGSRTKGVVQARHSRWMILITLIVATICYLSIFYRFILHSSTADAYCKR